MSQTCRVMRKKPFYNLFIITLTMQDFRLHNLLDRRKISSDSNVFLKTIRLRCCLIGVALIVKKLVVLQGHYKVQRFVNIEY